MCSSSSWRVGTRGYLNIRIIARILPAFCINSFNFVRGQVATFWTRSRWWSIELCWVARLKGKEWSGLKINTLALGEWGSRRRRRRLRLPKIKNRNIFVTFVAACILPPTTPPAHVNFGISFPWCTSAWVEKWAPVFLLFLKSRLWGRRSIPLTVVIYINSVVCSPHLICLYRLQCLLRCIYYFNERTRLKGMHSLSSPRLYNHTTLRNIFLIIQPHHVGARSGSIRM